MSPERMCDVLAQYTPQINIYSLLKLPLLGYEPKPADFEYVALNPKELLLLGKEGGASRAQALALALAVLAFANKHFTINTSLLSLQ